MGGILFLLRAHGPQENKSPSDNQMLSNGITIFLVQPQITFRSQTQGPWTVYSLQKMGCGLTTRIPGCQFIFVSIHRSFKVALHNTNPSKTRSTETGKTPPGDGGTGTRHHQQYQMRHILSLIKSAMADKLCQPSRTTNPPISTFSTHVTVILSLVTNIKFTPNVLPTKERNPTLKSEPNIQGCTSTCQLSSQLSSTAVMSEMSSQYLFHWGPS